MKREIIALDADGVLLDYGSAYAGAWHAAFGVHPRERDPRAYWPIDRWDVERLDGERLTQFRAAFHEAFWAAIPALPGAPEACHRLVEAGYELVCVTALPEEFRSARERNLRLHGFPIEIVHATSMDAASGSPKADALRKLQPCAFVDDFLPYFAGVDERIHRALVLREEVGSPNCGEMLRFTDSQHLDLAAFATWWLDGDRRADRK